MLPADPLLHLLLALPVLLVACYAGGYAARRLGQPPVIGEILAGIVLGPSLLGWLAPDLQHQLLPAAALPTLSALGNLGLLAFLFLIGAELDLRSLRTARRAVAAISLGSILLPLTLGGALAFAMYPALAPPGVHRLPFVLFIAVALSITAFPVLARVLADRHLGTSYLGSLALACAAINDVIAWCLLTAVIALSVAATPLTAVAAVAVTTVLAISLFLSRPALRRLLEGAARRGDDLVLVTLCAGFCLTAYATDLIGIHPAFGAFLFGAVTPRGIPAVERSIARLQTTLLPVLLPLYFAVTGLHTNLVDLRFEQWGWALAILAAAVAGKWCGAATAARLTGSSWRFATCVGVLMNCRGVTELVVLGIGLQIGVITPQLFALLVLMAIVTTAATGPLLSRLTHSGPAHPVPAPALVHMDAHANSKEQTE